MATGSRAAHKSLVPPDGPVGSAPVLLEQSYAIISLSTYAPQYHALRQPAHPRLRVEDNQDAIRQSKIEHSHRPLRPIKTGARRRCPGRGRARSFGLPPYRAHHLRLSLFTHPFGFAHVCKGPQLKIEYQHCFSFA